MTNRAVFLDRDGVINVDNGYVSKVDDFEFIDGVIEACQKIKEKGYQLIIITNQSGIARGYFSEDDFINLTQWMDWSLADKGVELDGIYYCPHHPEHGIGEYKQACDCRKPQPGMIHNATEHLGLDLSQCYLVGDKESDIKAGQNAGIATNILIKTGKAITEQGQLDADYIIDTLADLVPLLK